MLLVVLFPLLVSALQMGNLARYSQRQTWMLNKETRIFLTEDHRAPVLHIYVYFPVGTWSPWALQQHASEAFQIQKIDPEGRLLKQAADLGLGVDVGTDKFSSYLHVFCLKEDAFRVAALLHEILTNRDFDHSELVRWKWAGGAVGASSAEDPIAVLHAAIGRTFYLKEDPHRLDLENSVTPTTNTKMLLATRDTMIRVPGRVVAFAGDVNKKEAEALAKALRLPEPDWNLPKQLALKPSGFGYQAVREDKEAFVKGISQVFMGYVRTGLSISEPDFPKWLLADYLFGGNFYSRLYVALRHHEGDTYSPQTGMNQQVKPGIYEVVVYSRPDNAARIEKKLRDTLKHFAEEGITEKELKDALSHFRGKQTSLYQQPQNIVEDLVERFFQGQSPDAKELELQRLYGVSLQEINKFIKTFYDPKNFTMIQVRPKG